MKLNIFKYSDTFIYVILLTLISGIVGCTKDFDALNTPDDKINADDVGLNELGQEFANAQYAGLSGGNKDAFQRSQSLYTDLYAQYFAVTEPNFDSGQFKEIGAWTQYYYRDLYSNAAPELLAVEQFTAKNAMPVAHAIAKVWEVEMYHRITDIFGPVIYSHFGNAKTSVPYDSQESAYNRFFNTLDSAVVVLKEHRGEKAFGTNDLLYEGSVDQWLLFANSLRLRLALRIAYADPTLAKREGEKAVSAGVIKSNDDNATLLTSLSSLNFYAGITYLDEFRMSATMQSILAGYNDPRITSYFTPAKDGSGYKGVRNGLSKQDKGDFLLDTHAAINDRWRPLDRGGTNPPIYLMVAAEIYFDRAEGALRGWNMGGTAKELYNMGIKTSMKQWGHTSESGIAAYVNSTDTPIALNDKWNTPAASDIPVRFQTNTDFETQFEQIITQKWIALYPDSWEAWSERRRTGYPSGLPIIESLNPDIPEDKMMRRLKFTTGEISNNNAAVKAARKLLDGPDKNYTRIWWDAKNDE